LRQRVTALTLGRVQRPLLTVSLTVLSLAVGASGASAAVTGLEEFDITGESNSQSAKTVTSFCQGGKQALGGASGKTFEAQGQARLLAARPTSNLNAFVSSFREDETGFSGNWSATAYVICSDPLPGLQRVVRTSASSSAG
jgi:hypothetical protein